VGLGAVSPIFSHCPPHSKLGTFSNFKRYEYPHRHLHVNFIVRQISVIYHLILCHKYMEQEEKRKKGLSNAPQIYSSRIAPRPLMTDEKALTRFTDE